MGLMAAFVAESSTRFAMPLLAPRFSETGVWTLFWILVAVGSAIPIVVGVYLIRTRLAAAVASTPAVMRAERERLRSLEDAAGPPQRADSASVGDGRLDQLQAPPVRVEPRPPSDR